MTTVTAVRPDVPDFDYEYHTITVDTIGQSSANTFTAYLNTPLRNVVQARLLGARINTVYTTEHCYVSIQELDSNFADRAAKDPPSFRVFTARTFYPTKLLRQYREWFFGHFG
jgi:hypothetical protein